MKLLGDMRSRRATAGFTMVELLATLAILVMVAVVVANGVPAAFKAYEKVVDTANAQSALATASTRLRNLFDSATEVTASDGSLVSFVDGDTGYRTKVWCDATSGEIKRSDERTYKGASGDEGGEELLLSEEESANLIVTCQGIEYEGGLFTVKKLQVVNPRASEQGEQGEALADVGDKLVVQAIISPKPDFEGE